MKTDPVFLTSTGIVAKVMAAWPLRNEPQTPHGPEHWMRVAANSELLLRGEVEDEQLRSLIRPVLRLFALFHDSRRKTDGWCEEHGVWGGQAMLGVCGELLGEGFTQSQIGDAAFACFVHTESDPRDDATKLLPPSVRICLDADRLDLTRLGMKPDPRRLFTETGRSIANSLSNP